MKNKTMKFIQTVALAAALTATGFAGTPENYRVMMTQAADMENRISVTTPKGIADFGRGDASILIRGNEGQTLKGKKFHVYQLFDAENAVGGESVNYTFHPAYEKSLKTVVGKKLGKESAAVTEYEVIDYIQSLNHNQVEGSYSAYRYFIEELRDQIVKDQVSADIVNVTEVKADNSVSIQGLSYGYYIVDEVSEVGGTHSAASMCIVNTANPKADVNIKSDYPIVTKKIQEDDNREQIGNTGWNDIGDFEIGQTVPYKYESNIPNINGYDTYYYAWHDVMEEALTFQKDSVSVKIYESSDEQSKSYTLRKDEFSVILNPENE